MIAVAARATIPARRFFAIAAATAAVVCLATAAVNYIADPFGIYGIVDVRGFNDDKPDKYTRVRLLKAFEIQRIKPRAVALGTSRSQIGIRMTHPGWDPAADPRYNLAFDGATVHEMYAYLRHAQAVRPLREVVLGLDTWQLGDGPSGVRPDFDPTLLDSPGSAWRHIASRIARLRVAFSIDTALASMRTVEDQDPAAQDWFAQDGQRLGDVFFHRSGEEFTEGGPGTYFADIDRQEIGFKLDMGPPEHPHRGAGEPNVDLSSLDYVREIVAFCRANSIDLRIFITPAHAHQMEISAAVGEWPKIEAGKRMLVRILAEDPARHPGIQPFPLWDFSGYSSVTTEPVPPPGSRREMAYYWDSSHFKENVGDWALDRLFGFENGVPEDFGVKLTAESIDRALERIRADRTKYRREHPEDVAGIRAMVADVYRQVPPPLRVSIEGAE